MTDGVQHRRDPAIRCFPDGCDPVKWIGLMAGCNVVPAPMIQQRNMAVKNKPVAEQKDFAQEVAGAEEILFGVTGAHCWFHVTSHEI